MRRVNGYLQVWSGWIRGLAAASLVLLVAACSGNVQVHGNMPDPVLVSEIQPGAYGQRDVASLLGSPSTVSTFGDNRWYYVGQTVSTFAFFKPKVLERNVLVVSFDSEGRVQATRTYTLADGRKVSPVGRVTPTEGRDMTVLQQLLGNFGRFSPGDVQQR